MLIYDVKSSKLQPGGTFTSAIWSLLEFSEKVLHILTSRWRQSVCFPIKRIITQIGFINEMHTISPQGETHKALQSVLHQSDRILSLHLIWGSLLHLAPENLPFSHLLNVNCTSALISLWRTNTCCMTRVCDSSETLNHTAEEFLFLDTKVCVWQEQSFDWVYGQSFVKLIGGKHNWLSLVMEM